VLLTSLDPAAVAAGRDLADAVRIDGVSLSRSDAVGPSFSTAALSFALGAFAQKH
jgi:fatty acid CoA ligase FadD36